MGNGKILREIKNGICTMGNRGWRMGNGEQTFISAVTSAARPAGFLDGEGCVRVIDLERFSCQASHTAYCTITLFPCSGA